MNILTIVLPLVLMFVSLYPCEIEIKLLRLLVITVFFDLYANLGMMFSIGGFDVKYADLSWIFVWVFSIIILLRNKVKKTDALRLQIMQLSLIVTLLSECILPVGVEDNLARSIMVSVRMLMSLVTVTAVGTISPEIMTSDFWIKTFSKLQKSLYFILAIEFVCKKIMHSTAFTSVTIGIFGMSENQVTWQVARGGTYALQGLTKEPSHLAIALFVSSIIDIVLMEKKGLKYVFFNLALLLISGSFSSVLFCLLIIYLLSVHCTNNVKKIGAFTVVMAVCLIMPFFADNIPILGYYMSRLEEAFMVISGKNVGVTSNAVRLGSITTSISDFVKKPFFGIGAGNNVGTGALMALLSAIGIIGVLLYFFGFVDGKIVKNKANLCAIFVLFVGSFFTMDIGAFYSAWFIAITKICEIQKQ